MDQGRRSRGRAALWALVPLCFAAGEARASDPFGKEDRPTATGVPVPYVERPVVTPFRSMEIFGTVPVVRFAPFDPVAGMQFGVRHGLYEDWELGALLWPFAFKDGLAVDGPPSLFAARRYVFSPHLEVALLGRIAVPLVFQAWGGEVSVPLLLRFGPTRIDTGVGYFYTQGAELGRHLVLVPFRFSLQVLPELRLSLTASGQVARGPAGRSSPLVANAGVGAEVAYTIPGEVGGALCDVIVSGSFPEVVRSHQESPTNAFASWALSLSARFYFYFGHSTWEDDSFID